MKKLKEVQPDAVDQLLAGLRASQSELAALRELEQSGKNVDFTKKMIALDKRETLQGLTNLKGLNQSKINPMALRLASSADQRAQGQFRAAGIGTSLIASLLVQKQVVCNCLMPFTFAGLKTFNAMSGPDQSDVRNGLLGAMRLADDEYSISNPGNTVGKTRVGLSGQMHLSFSAVLPKSGRYCLLIPAGYLWIHGHSRVVGHGNMTTSYDAKVWVNHYMVLEVGWNLLEISGGQIHYDATRSEDRTRNFVNDLVLDPRYVFFHGNSGDELTLSFRLEVDTEANEDGIAIVVVDAFGFPANTKQDYDTFVIKTS